MAKNTNKQTAYKDSNGNIKYKNTNKSNKKINSGSDTSSNNKKSNKDKVTVTLTSNYTIPTSDENAVYTFEDLSVTTVTKSTITPIESTNKGDTKIKNANNYPTYLSKDENSGRFSYDYTITIQKDILNSIASIKKNLNVPSAYTRLELNKLFHTQFNRFRIQYPDYFMNNTIGYVVFTRPDLNLYNGSTVLTQVTNDPQLYYIMKASPETAKTLTKGYSSKHYFNPLLTNTVMSLDVSDESIDTLETGETFTGYKTQYAKSNIRSMTAGTISLTFPETYNASLTHLHQLWCAYESGVYRGSLKPKSDYIWNKELDYACDIYYFLLDAEDMILRYWCKYTGCFPLNVNKSVFSFNGDTQINHPMLNVSYAYFAREDMSMINLNEFNNNSSGSSSSFKYKANYIPSLGSCGNTWSGTPFIVKVTQGTGFTKDAELFALRFRSS